MKTISVILVIFLANSVNIAYAADLPKDVVEAQEQHVKLFKFMRACEPHGGRVSIVDGVMTCKDGKVFKWTY